MLNQRGIWLCQSQTLYPMEVRTLAEIHVIPGSGLSHTSGILWV